MKKKLTFKEVLCKSNHNLTLSCNDIVDVLTTDQILDAGQHKDNDRLCGQHYNVEQLHR